MTEAPGVTNPAVRAALDQFVAAGGSGVDVLRWCLQGFLLLDVTGSDIRMSADGSEIEAGSTVRIAAMAGPDGGSALAAFTSTAEIEKAHERDGAGGGVQSLVQPAAAVLELALEQDHQWLCLDPAGPGCALSREEIEFALRVPRNDAVRQALDVANVDPDQRTVLLDALRAEGVFVLAVDGQADTGADAAVRITTMPDDRPALMVFTSGPEAAARCAEGDTFMVWSTAEVNDALRDGDLAGLVVNPAGPWAAVTTDELFGSPPPEKGSDMSDWNDQIIAEFRANEGRVGGQFAGAPMVLLHHTGRQSGREYVTPLVYQPDRTDEHTIYVFASAAGAPKDPQWYANIVAAGHTSVEVGTETYDVRVETLSGEDRERIYAAQVEAMPGFGGYAEKTAGIRVIPVVALHRV